MRKPLRIVAADDEPDMAEFYQSALAHLGHEVAVAADGRQLVELCRRERPQLVITDVRMPGLDGVEALAEVWRTWPVSAIVVSAHAPGDLAGRVPEGSKVVFLQKPVGLADLEEAIDRVAAEQGPPVS